MSATDTRHGRRGGRWASEGAGHLAVEARLLLEQWRAGGGRLVDHSDLFHPDAIAKGRAHARSCRHDPRQPCPAVPDPGDLAEVWAGRARMATARKAAGRPLDDVDEEALRRAAASEPAAGGG